ncbi:hypothetical protein HJ588_12555 [Flexivirga sp. ID2601S]|uniref:Uncharacterized protein n=1 Tax=Flexivirga aerilata TaxID=1656889 RepID=A0A849AGX2_9MICO|nr:hypothetical protein [Flexivirga aerilata]NNG40094.1 hypothetical protein [Flexivirga aerilata]
MSVPATSVFTQASSGLRLRSTVGRTLLPYVTASQSNTVFTPKANIPAGTYTLTVTTTSALASLTLSVTSSDTYPGDDSATANVLALGICG